MHGCHMTDEQLAEGLADRVRNIMHLAAEHKALPLFCILTDPSGRTVCWMPQGTPPAQIVNLIQNDFLPMFKEASGL